MGVGDKICPYCHKSINGCFIEGVNELKCPHADCEKRIPGEYLNNSVKHVSSISQNENFMSYVSVLQMFIDSSGKEFNLSRVEYVFSDSKDVQIVLFEYSDVDYEGNRRTEVIVFHHSVWSKEKEKTKRNIGISSTILLNVDITEFNGLFLNSGVTRSRDEFINWNPIAIGQFIRDISKYLSTHQLSRRVAILFGNIQAIYAYPCFRQDDTYKKLVEVTGIWSGRIDDRLRIKDSHKIIKRLLIEVGEESFVEYAERSMNVQFFLYPSSEYLMTSSEFWLMAVLLWACVRIE